MSGPIDINLLVDQLFKDMEELKLVNSKEIAWQYLHSAYRAGVEHGTEHGWHEKQDQDEEC